MTSLSTAARQEKIRSGLKKRHRAETRFRLYGATAITFGLMCVLFLFYDITSKGVRS